MRKVRKNLGFTLSEMAIVVIVLGIVAALVVPQFTNAGVTARDSTLVGRLAEVRGALERFQADHEGHAPGVEGMWALLTGKSDTGETAVVAGCGTALGPYLSVAPENPLNGLTGVSTSEEADTMAGWFYRVEGGRGRFYPRDGTGQVLTGY